MWNPMHDLVLSPLQFLNLVCVRHISNVTGCNGRQRCSDTVRFGLMTSEITWG